MRSLRPALIAAALGVLPAVARADVLPPPPPPPVRAHAHVGLGVALASALLCLGVMTVWGRRHRRRAYR